MRALEKAVWYRNRLRCMTAQEIGHRTRNALTTRLQRHGLGLAREAPAPDTARRSKPFIHPVHAAHTAAYRRAAEEVIKGEFPILSIQNPRLSSPPQWNRDPRTHTLASKAFGKTIDYRDPAQVGDIKYLWELNRHLQLPVLAQAYCLSGERRYLEAIRTQLNSWLEQCPYPLGPNWTSSLELGIRLINWSITWQLIWQKEDETGFWRENQVLERQWLDAIYRHAHFIHGYFSRHSSANNHLIGEAAGLFVASMTWPFWDDLKGWGEEAREILQTEALKQNAPDGVNREQTVSYQQFVLDFLVMAGLAGKANGVEFPPEYWSRIESMLDYIAAIMDVVGNVPAIGDSDDALVARLSQEPEFCPYRSLLATGAILFSRADFAAKAKALDDKSRWLLGSRAEEFDSIKVNGAKRPVRNSFPEGGYYILGSDFETPDEIKLVVDAGPLGYQAIAAHGHADALAFTLSVKGREFLVDPGTYAYHTMPKWRNYFRSTAAHNTIRIDGEEQSVMGGNFMWTHHANARCETWLSANEKDVFIGSHDGYARLSDRVIHRRQICFDKYKKYFEVKDKIECLRTHVVERCWHASESCSISKVDHALVLENNGVSVSLICEDRESSFQEYRGDEVRPAGWVSRRLDEKEPTTTLIWRSEIAGSTTLSTIIDCSAAFE